MHPMHFLIKLISSLLLLVGVSATQARQLAQNSNWWQTEVFYQIYPRSFKDSNGDGIGDLQGITSKLEYFQQTGITAVWLSPIFKSPMVDFGYDISDYKAIQPEYGTLADLDALLAKATQLGIKVILDFVPNHSSDQHEWFKKSAARVPGYEDFYIWRDGKRLQNGTRLPPNNWRSVFAGSAWKWHEQRQQYYLHQFTSAQPDFNYRNPAVQEAMDDVMRYWLDRGVTGFRIDAIIFVYEDAQLRDEPLSSSSSDPNSYDYLEHIYTVNEPETITLVQHWRQLLDDYSAQHGGPARIMMTEGYAPLPVVMEYYENKQGVQGAHFPFNFDFITSVNDKSKAKDFLHYIQRWLDNMPGKHAANWVMGNHDRPRVGSRYGAQAVDAMNMLLMTLPGIAVTYYGEELGMLDYRDISWQQTVDKPACDAGPERYKWVSRDPVRTPMQWSAEAFAGFSRNASWLPVHPNYKQLNLHAQQQATHSHWKVYKALLELRQLPVLQRGEFQGKVLNSAVFAFKRVLRLHHTLLTIINVSNDTQQVSVAELVKLPYRLVVLVAGVDSAYAMGDRLKASSVKLAPHEGLVCKLRL